MICIKNPGVAFGQSGAMPSRQKLKVRPCPLCGIAMQASKSRDELAEFDIFECQTCRTTISESKPPQPGSPRTRQ